MASYVIHLAIAQEYLKNNKEDNVDDFLYGSVYPDLIRPKSSTHYGEVPAQTSLKKFLEDNKINTSFKRGCFLHLITDYLFYNYYLNSFIKEDIYNDYDVLNKKIVEKYNVKLLSEIKDIVKFIDGETKILSYELACQIIDEVSRINLDRVKKEVKKDDEKWRTYRNLD